MSEIFADTSAWGNLVDPSQAYHALAAKLYRTARQQRRKVITTNCIITEVVALMTIPLRTPRPKIIAFIEGLKSSPHVEIVHVDQTLDNQAWQLLKRRSDKEWSLVDCSSSVLMQQLGIMEALTTDHHFEQAGFVSLLKQSLGVFQQFWCLMRRMGWRARMEAVSSPQNVSLAE